MAVEQAEIYQEMEAHLVEVFADMPDPAKMARKVVGKLRELYAKQQIYFPSDDHISRFNRDCEMWKEYQEKGADPAAIAKKHNITVQCFYRRMEQVHGLMYEKKQPKLF